MKRLIIALVMLSVVFGAFAGGQQESGEEQVVLRALVTNHESLLMYRDVFFPKFEEETGIKVIVDALPESGYEQKLRVTMGAGNSEYDIVQIGGRTLGQAVSGGWITPLNEYMNDSTKTDQAWAEGFADRVMDICTVDNNLYGVPWQIGSNILFYNKAMFREAGLDDSKGPADLEELEEYARILTKPEKNQYGFVQRAKRDDGSNGFAWIMMWLAKGGRWTDVEGYPDYAVLNHPIAKETTDLYVRLLNNYGPPGVSSYGWPEAQLAMQQGRVAMWLGAAQLGLELEDPEKSTIAGDVGYAIIGGAEDEEWYTVGSPWMFSMAATTEHPEEVWEVLQYMTGYEVVMEQVLAKVHGSPVRKDVLLDDQITEVFPAEFAEALSVGVGRGLAEYTPFIPEGPQIRDFLSIAISSAMTGQQSVDEAMEEANNKIKELLDIK